MGSRVPDHLRSVLLAGSGLRPSCNELRNRCWIRHVLINTSNVEDKGVLLRAFACMGTPSPVSSHLSTAAFVLMNYINPPHFDSIYHE